MSKTKRKKNKGRIFTPTAPEDNSRRIIGTMWRVASHEIAEQVIIEMRQTLRDFAVKPGERIRAYEFYAVKTDENSYVILLGHGTMFSVRFLEACGICIGVYKGTLVTDTAQILAWIDELTPRWQADCRQDRKKQAAMRRTARNLFSKERRGGFGSPAQRSQQTRNGIASAPRGRMKFKR